LKHLTEELLWLILGWLLGVVAGLLPGIHANTISFLLLGFAANTGQPDKWAYVVVGMNIVQAFVDFIPNIFLGLPDSEAFASLLPGHRFLAKGKGLYAVRLGIIGALSGSLLAALLFPLFAGFLAKALDFVEAIIPLALGLVLVSLVAGERDWKKRGQAVAVIALAGGFGLLTLPSSAFADPLFPAITGLFGVAGLLNGLRGENRVPEQLDGISPLKPKNLLEGGVLGSLAAGIVALLPAIGPGEASYLLMKLFKKTSASLYLIIVGCINAANLLFSFLFLYLLGKTRTGAAAALERLGLLDAPTLVAVTGASLVSAAAGAWLCLWLAKAAAKKISQVNYRSLNAGVICFLGAIVFLLQGLPGLLVLVVGTAIGLVPLAFGVRRAHAMSYLMVPTLAYYLGFPG